MKIEKNLRRLAEAFVRVAIEQGMLETCHRDVEKLKDFFVRSPSLRQFMFSESIESEKKKRVFNEALKEEFSPPTIGLLFAVIDSGYERKLFRLLSYVKKLFEREEAAAVVEVYSAMPLRDSLRKEIERFSREISGREIKIREKVDDSLIGGLILKIGDKLYDGSLISRLRRFKKAVSERV